jgi:hypothetical protein
MEIIMIWVCPYIDLNKTCCQPSKFEVYPIFQQNQMSSGIDWLDKRGFSKPNPISCSTRMRIGGAGLGAGTQFSLES